MITTEELYGAEWSVCAVVRDGKHFARDHINDMKRTRAKDHKRLVALLDMVSREGPPFNHREKCRKVQGDIWELKSYQDRLFFFRDGPRRIVITHGVVKKKDQLERQEVERAIRLHAEYIKSA